MRTVTLALFLIAAAVPQLMADRAEGSFERTLSVSGPVQLNVDTGSGNIIVRRGSAGSMRIQAKISANRRMGGAAELVREVEQNPPVRQSGNVITIGSAVRKWDNVGISYEISTPADSNVRAASGSGNVECHEVHGPVEATSGSGHVRVEGIGAEVRARTGSGNVVVARTEGAASGGSGSGNVELTAVSGAADAHTGSGNIAISRATGAVRARTGSGTIRVVGAASELDLESGSGEIDVDGAPKSSRWAMRTGSGSLRVSLPQGTGFELDAHAGSGTISTSHPVTVQGIVRKNELRGVAIRADNRLMLRTGSGNIRID